MPEFLPVCNFEIYREIRPKAYRVLALCRMSCRFACRLASGAASAPARSSAYWLNRSSNAPPGLIRARLGQMLAALAVEGEAGQAGLRKG